MTTRLTDEQQEIRTTARGFLAAVSTSEAVRAATESARGFDEAAWERVVELGWPAMCISQEHGGFGFGQVDRALLLEEMGRALFASPYLSTAVLAADAVALSASAAARADLLPRIAEDGLRAALVSGGDLHGHADPAGAVSAADDGGAWSLSGSGGLALDAASADVLVVVARTADGPGLFRLDPGTSGLDATAVDLMDGTRRFARVALLSAPADRIDDGEVAAGLARARLNAVVALSAEMVGAAERCLDMSVEYAKQRRQFGVPIGSFQVIKHRCAILAIEVNAAREGVMHAAAILDTGDPADAEILASAAKHGAGLAFQRAVHDTIQIHGGIGFTFEHDAHLFLKRARTCGLMLGSTGAHGRRVAELLDV